MATPVASLAVSVTADTSQATTQLGNLTGLLSHTGPLFLAVLGVTAVVAGVGIAATKMAGDFQAGITSLATGAGESQANLQMVSDAILKMATDTGTSTSQLISGMYMIESAGYHGAAGLAVLQAAAEGAKVGNADLGTVADAVTTVMKDYASSGVTAAGATNLLIATVANGKTHMQDLASSMSTVLPAAAAMKLPLDDVMAAMADLTGQGTDAATAATYLRQTFLMLEAPTAAATTALNNVGLTTGQVAAEMQTNLPGAFKMILDHINETYTQGSPQWTAAMKDIVGGTRSMAAILELTSSKGMADFFADQQKITAAVKDGGTAITGWNLVQGTFNQKMAEAGEVVETLMIKLGQQLLPVATKLASLFANDLPKAISTVTNLFNLLVGGTTAVSVPFTQVGNTVRDVNGHFIELHTAIQGVHTVMVSTGLAAHTITQTFTQFAPIVGIVAGVIGGILVATLWAAATAAWAFVAPILVMLAPFIAVGVAIGILAGLIIKFHTQLQPVADLFQEIGTLLAPIGAVLKTQIGDVLNTIGQQIQSSFLPAWHNIQAVLVQLQPVFEALGIVLGVTLVLAFGALVGIITGLVTGLGAFLSGVIQFMGGIVLAVTSSWNLIASIVGGILAIIGDIIHGNWSQIGVDATKMWNGIKDKHRRYRDGSVASRTRAVPGHVRDYRGSRLRLHYGHPGLLPDALRSADRPFHHPGYGDWHHLVDREPGVEGALHHRQYGQWHAGQHRVTARQDALSRWLHHQCICPGDTRGHWERRERRFQCPRHRRCSRRPHQVYPRIRHWRHDARNRSRARG